MPQQKRGDIYTHFFPANIALRHSTRPPFDLYYHTLQEIWVIERFTETFRRIQGRQTPRASHTHTHFYSFAKFSYTFYFFIKTMFFLAHPGKRVRDNYRQLNTMFFNFELIWAWCSYELGSYKEKKVYLVSAYFIKYDFMIYLSGISSDLILFYNCLVIYLWFFFHWNWRRR